MKLIHHAVEAQYHLASIMSMLHNRVSISEAFYVAVLTPDATEKQLLNAAALEHIGEVVLSAFDADDNDASIVLASPRHLILSYRVEAEICPESLMDMINRSPSPHIPWLEGMLFHLPEHACELESYMQEVIWPGDRPGMNPHKEDIMERLVPHMADALSAWKSNREGREGRSKPHLMLVEDDAFTRTIVSRSLRDDYPLTSACNGAEALEKQCIWMPDIVFLDLGLPDVDGFALLRQITMIDPYVMVIIFSGQSFLDHRLRALHEGAKGFLPKPFDRHAFDHYIAHWQRHHQPQLSLL